MSRPTNPECALLKLLATSIIFLVEEKHRLKVEFCLPYLVENDIYKAPRFLWLPDLDEPFKSYVSTEENKKLWESFHTNGRKKDEAISIWKFISDIGACHCEEHIHIDVTHELGCDLTLAPKGEFEINELEDKVLVLTTARQSCGTLIAVITLVLPDTKIKVIDELKQDVKKYMGHVQKSRYLGLFKELNLPSINAATWKNMRMTPGANHWGDESDDYKEFFACTEEWCKQLKLDFSGNFKESDLIDESHGRPALRDILSIDKSDGRIQRVIECRVRSQIGENSRIKWMVGAEVTLKVIEEGKEIEVAHDYLWFNALAVADCLVGAIKGYGGLTSETTRIKVNDYYKAHPFVFMHLLLRVNYLEVQIYEPGLEGEFVVKGTGNAFENILEPAKNSGASKFKLFVKDKTYSLSYQDGTLTYEENRNSPPPFLGFTGLTFSIEYCDKDDREIVWKGEV